jgi:hypothetical protein
MVSSGTYTFNPANSDIVLDAFDMCGVPATELLQRHMRSAYRQLNYMFADWSNKGVNLFAVDSVEQTLLPGITNYNVDAQTVDLLDVYISYGTPAIDRIITSISRSEWAAIPQKALVGVPTTFWYNKLTNPIINIWPVPATSGYTLKYYRLKRMQDANITGGETPEVPYRWVDAVVMGLAARLAVVYAPDKMPVLDARSREAYLTASRQDTEDAAFYISPQLNTYWRP